MKNLNLKLILAASLLVAFATSCTQSSEENKQDPAILTYIVNQSLNNNAGNFDEVTNLCLSNVALMNTCVAGTGQGQGFSGNLCSTPITREKIGTLTASTCIGNAIKLNNLNCNFPENRFLDATAANDTFKACITP